MAILRIVKDGGTMTGYDKVNDQSYSLGFSIAVNAGILTAISTGGSLVDSSDNPLTGEQGGSSFGFAISPRTYILTAGSTGNQGQQNGSN